MPFTEKSLTEIWSNYHSVHQKYESLMTRFLRLRLSNPRAKEFATQGIIRRLGIMVQCIDNVFVVVPPERQDALSRQERLNVTINIQAFMVNVFGSIDNLAWIWVKEKEVTQPTGKPLPSTAIGLGSKCTIVRESFSQTFQKYLKTMDPWFEGMGDYRNALAHRISPYIPPYVVTSDNQAAYEALSDQMNAALTSGNFPEWDRLSTEQDGLGTFRPWMQHSFEEGATPFYFHPQLLADFNTVEDIALKMLDEFQKR